MSMRSWKKKTNILLNPSLTLRTLWYLVAVSAHLQVSLQSLKDFYPENGDEPSRTFPGRPNLRRNYIAEDDHDERLEQHAGWLVVCLFAP